MKITEVRTRVVQWEGNTVPLPPHFCTNPMDLVAFREASMGNFAFHGWVLVEIFTDNGLVGLGNAALSPVVTKACIDTYLKPLLIGADPWDTEYLWQQMYRRTMAFGRKGVAMTAISAVDIALWDILGKDAKQPVFRLLGGRTKEKIPVYASRLYSMPLDELRVEAQRYKDEGYKAMKLRFGWGPIDGAAGMQKNVELVKTVREVVGDGVDVMADAYMGWTLDYAKRMLPLLERFNLRWLEEPVIPDDTRGYRELKSYGRIPIAGGEHEFTIFGFRDLLEANALDYIQFDTNRVGGISQARKISALGRIVPGPRRSARRPDAQLPRRHGQPQLAHRRVLSQGRRRSRQRALLVHLQWRARAHRRIHRSRRQHPRPRPHRQRRVAQAIHHHRVVREGSMVHLVQIADSSTRRVVLVDEPNLRCLEGVTSVYELAQRCLQEAKPLAEFAQSLATGETLPYDDVYAGHSPWRLLAPIDVPGAPSRVLVAGTGLTHLGSAKERQAMHAAEQPEEAAPVTDSMRMFQWGVEAGRPAQNEIGIAPEWFYKGDGSMIRAPFQPLNIPGHAEDGGEEAEIAGIYLIAEDGTPFRIGMTVGNEFSDHKFEKRNYLNLAGSKLRACSLGPELVVGAAFNDIPGEVRIERGGQILWQRQIVTGEHNMCHSLANLEYHHFKFEGHRQPGNVHVHFFGANALSFGDGIELGEGDWAAISFRGFGRALRNPIRVDERITKPISVQSLA